MAWLFDRERLGGRADRQRAEHQRAAACLQLGVVRHDRVGRATVIGEPFLDKRSLLE
jgi:hypothetical protein